MVDAGDSVEVTTLPGKPVGTVVRRCYRDDHYVWVSIPGRETLERVRESKLRKVKDDGK